MDGQEAKGASWAALTLAVQPRSTIGASILAPFFAYYLKKKVAVSVPRRKHSGPARTNG